MKPRRSDFLSAFLRGFAIQASWNYRTMIGGGMGFALAPLLQRIHAGDPVALREAMARHTEEFNAHPYLAPIAIGALARAEYEGAPPETVARFRDALRAPLGALGDQAVWAGWRPFCVSSAIVAHLLGVGAVAATVAFLVVYNAVHIAIRAWGFRLGWDEGLSIGSSLRSARLRSLAPRLVPVNLALTGAVAVLLIARLPDGPPEPWMGAAAAAVGLTAYFVPRRLTVPVMAALFAALAAWLL